MEDDEDDFYGGNSEHNAEGDRKISGKSNANEPEAMDLSEEEEDDSDDDVQFTLEKPEVTKPDAVSATRAPPKAAKVESSTTSQPRTTRQSTAAKQNIREPQTTKNELLHNGKEGKDFPEHRTSNVDVEEDPTWPANGKTITELDIDADLAEHSKPWRLPGTDVTDFFNYGFDEYTWTQYCAKQQSMSNTISELKDQDTMMKSMLGSMPNMSEGMPDMNQMMQMMMSGMGGSDPTKTDFAQMMAMGMPGMPPVGPGQQQNAGFNGQGVFNGPQGTGSPLPQAGQGFQAPLGPSALQNAGGMNMEGFSTQQMAIIQQEQQQGHQGGGGRGRGRRGRGYY